MLHLFFVVTVHLIFFIFRSPVIIHIHNQIKLLNNYFFFGIDCNIGVITRCVVSSSRIITKMKPFCSR